MHHRITRHHGDALRRERRPQGRGVGACRKYGQIGLTAVPRAKAFTRELVVGHVFGGSRLVLSEDRVPGRGERIYAPTVG